MKLFEVIFNDIKYFVKSVIFKIFSTCNFVEFNITFARFDKLI